MKKSKLSEDAIIRGIKSGDIEQERIISQLYEQYFYLVAKSVRRLGISTDQALSAYSDAILTFRKHILEDTFRYQSSVFTYLQGIFYRKCGNAFQKNKTNKAQALAEIPLFLTDTKTGIQEQLEIKEKTAKLKHFMEQLNDPCHDLLLDVAYWGMKMEEVAQKYRLNDAQAARNKKLSCLRALKRLIAKANYNPDNFS